MLSLGWRAATEVGGRSGMFCKKLTIFDMRKLIKPIHVCCGAVFHFGALCILPG